MINELKAGMKAEMVVLLRVQKIGQSSNGGVFARGLLEDNSGCVPYICFEAGPVDKMKALQTPQAVKVSGSVDINKYAGDMALQFVVAKLAMTGAEDDLSHLLPQGDFDVELYKAKLEALLAGIEHNELQRLARSLFSGATLAKFLKNPAGMRLHHAYVGGLLEHTVSTAELAKTIAEKIDGTDLDLVVTGALVHDIGKIEEISAELGFPYTTEGRLIGHITLAVLAINKAAAAMDMKDADKLTALLHIVLSHHGEQEKGSPMACATKESFIVHYADELDAIMNQFKGPDKHKSWEYNRMLQRYLYSPS